MEQKSKDTFYLDPDYENFVLRKTPLKYNTFGSGWLIISPIILAFLAGFIVFGFVSFAYESLRDYWRFSLNGQETVATVTHCEVIRQEKRSNTLEVGFVYTIDNVEYQAQDRWVEYAAQCGQYLTGSQINIQYNAENPAYARTIEEPSWVHILIVELVMIFTWVISLLVFIFGIFVIVHEIYALYKYQQLRSNGVVLEGEVVKAEYVKQPLRYGHRFALTITTEFETPDGRTLIRRFRDAPVYSNTKTREIPPAGTRVMILYANDYALIML